MGMRWRLLLTQQRGSGTNSYYQIRSNVISDCKLSSHDKPRSQRSHAVSETRTRLPDNNLLNHSTSVRTKSSCCTSSDGFVNLRSRSDPFNYTATDIMSLSCSGPALAKH